MSKTITCDICGRVYQYSMWRTKSRRETNSPIPNRIELRNVNPDTDTYYQNESLDICTDCFNKFSKWVNDQRKQRMEEPSRDIE